MLLNNERIDIWWKKMKLDAMSIVNSFPLVRDRVILLIHRNSIVYVFLQVNNTTLHLIFFFEVVLITSLFSERSCYYTKYIKVDLFEKQNFYILNYIYIYMPRYIPFFKPHQVVLTPLLSSSPSCCGAWYRFQETYFSTVLYFLII